MSGASSVVTETLTGRVKWYDSVKGYGFVAVDDQRGDVLLHANCLRRSGVAEAPEGAVVVLEVVDGERGRQAVSVVEVRAADAAAPEEPATPRPTQVAQTAPAAGDWLPMRVKWFDRAKGFGFLNAFGDSADVFVHMETLRAAGLTDLDAGEAVAAKITQGPRGKMAAEVTPWENVEAASASGSGSF